MESRRSSNGPNHTFGTRLFLARIAFNVMKRRKEGLVFALPANAKDERSRLEGPMK